MSTVNQCVLMGRTTKELELGHTTAGGRDIVYTNFTIAVEDRYKKPGQDKVDVSFFRVSAFGPQAEFAAKYVAKGTRIVVIGSLKQDDYTNKEGQKVQSVKISASDIQIADGRRSTGESDPAGFAPAGEEVNFPFY